LSLGYGTAGVTVTRIWAGQSTNHDWIPGRGKIVSSSSECFNPVQWVHGHFVQGVKLTTHLHVVLW